MSYENCGQPDCPDCSVQHSELPMKNPAWRLPMVSFEQIKEEALKRCKPIRKLIAERIHKEEPPEILNQSSLITTERLATLKIGQAFGIATREGIKIFKLVEIKKYEEKKEGGI